MRVVTLLLLWIAAPALWAGLDKAMAEKNLEKRSDLALENAKAVLADARKLYDKGDSTQVRAFLDEVRESVALAENSLRDSGKNPLKHPKYFKKAEINTRDMLRTLENFRDAMSVDDRQMLDPLRSKVQQVHETMLLNVMEGRKKK